MENRAVTHGLEMTSWHSLLMLTKKRWGDYSEQDLRDVTLNFQQGVTYLFSRMR